MGGVKSMKLKFNLESLLIRLIGLYSIGVLLYNQIVDFFPLSKLSGIAVFILLLFMFLKKSRQNKRSKNILVVLAMLLVLYTFLVASNKGLNLTNGIYWVSTILCVVVFSNKNLIEKTIKKIDESYFFIKIIVIINELILLFCLLTPSCYNNEWGGVYLFGFASSNHVLACGCCLTMVMSFFVAQREKNVIKRIIYILIPIYSILQTGSRVYLLSVIVLLVVFYKYCIKGASVKLLVLPIGTLCGVYFFLNSGIYAKFVNPSTYGNLVGMEKLTSGRTAFWLIDILQYLHADLVSQIFGSGFDFSSHINSIYYGMAIWAHNDLIEVVLSVGIMGLLVYLASVLGLIFGSSIDKIGKCLLFIYFFGIAFLNGLFGYQHYLYSVLLLYIFMNQYGKNITNHT